MCVSVRERAVVRMRVCEMVGGKCLREGACTHNSHSGLIDINGQCPVD